MLHNHNFQDREEGLAKGKELIEVLAGTGAEGQSRMSY